MHQSLVPANAADTIGRATGQRLLAAFRKGQLGGRGRRRTRPALLAQSPIR